MATNDISRVRSDFAEALLDGKVTGPEATRLVRRVREDQLTESEAKTFRRELVRHGERFDADATKIFDDFKKIIRRNTVLDDGPRPNPGGLPDPSVLPADIDRLQQEMIRDGELFRNGVTAKDPEQLYLGDCFLMAAMSSVAAVSPGVIRNAFKRVRANVYEVTLYDGHSRPHKVTIDTDLPRNGWYGYYYARAHDPKELWPALLEKAFAVRAGSYSGIDGGLGGDAMHALTGKPSVDTLTRGNRITPEQMFETIKTAIDAGKPTTAATYGESPTYTNTGIHGDHTYAVLGTSSSGGVSYVKLRNPWGSSEPQGNGRDDGVFKIDIKTFMKLFWGISVNG